MWRCYEYTTCRYACVCFCIIVCIIVDVRFIVDVISIATHKLNDTSTYRTGFQRPRLILFVMYFVIPQREIHFAVLVRKDEKKKHRQLE